MNANKELQEAVVFFKDVIATTEPILAECTGDLKRQMTEQKKRYNTAIAAMELVLLWNGKGADDERENR